MRQAAQIVNLFPAGTLKPEIPLLGKDDMPICDEIELALDLLAKSSDRVSD